MSAAMLNSLFYRKIIIIEQVLKGYHTMSQPNGMSFDLFLFCHINAALTRNRLEWNVVLGTWCVELTVFSATSLFKSEFPERITFVYSVSEQ